MQNRERPEPHPILTLADDRVAVTINDDFSGAMVDRVRDQTWQLSPCCLQEHGPLSQCAIWNRMDRCYMDHYPAFFRARRTDDGLRVTVVDQLGQPRGELRCAVTVRDGAVRFRIDAIDEKLPSLVFPPYLESDDVVIPRILGEWWRGGTPRTEFVMPASGWGMRWFGGLRGENGWVAIVEEGYADSGVYISGAAACAAWQKSMGRWQGGREVTIRFSGNGYVGLAKTFRAYARQHGLFKGLDDKIAEVPQLANLIGGRNIAFFQGYTHHAHRAVIGPLRKVTPEMAAAEGRFELLIPFKDVLTVIAEAKAAGMSKGYFTLRGWLDGGYDERHPDTWPHDPRLGSEEELRRYFDQGDSFVPLLHDNFQDIYRQSPSFPRYVQRDPQGDYKAGGTWHGGRCYVLNAEKALEYVRRNWETLRRYGPRGAFVDCIGGAHFQEDYAPEHPLPRAGDAAGKLEQIRFYRAQGLMVGTEWGSDFSINDIDFCETRQNPKPHFAVPLWPLVYHDAAVTLRYRTGTADYDPADDLADMLWGYAKLWPCGSLANWRRSVADFRRSFAVDRWHERIGRDEMTNHRYLDPAGLVEQTEFSSGASIVVNFGDAPYDHEGRAVPPQGHVILD